MCMCMCACAIVSEGESKSERVSELVRDIAEPTLYMYVYMLLCLMLNQQTTFV